MVRLPRSQVSRSGELRERTASPLRLRGCPFDLCRKHLDFNGQLNRRSLPGRKIGEILRISIRVLGDRLDDDDRPLT